MAWQAVAEHCAGGLLALDLRGCGYGERGGVMTVAGLRGVLQQCRYMEWLHLGGPPSAAPLWGGL